jgi:hypothetical protein
VRVASACNDVGWVAEIAANRAQFLFDSTLAKLSVDVNHTFGSFAFGLSWLRAIAIVRAFMSS